MMEKGRTRKMTKNSTCTTSIGTVNPVITSLTRRMTKVRTTHSWRRFLKISSKMICSMRTITIMLIIRMSIKKSLILKDSSS